MEISSRKIYNLLTEGYCRYMYIHVSAESIQTNYCRDGGNMRFLMVEREFKSCNRKDCPIIKQLKNGNQKEHNRNNHKK